MKIFVTGTRGIPDISGGVEKHCQELYQKIISSGHEVFLATRKPYVRHEQDHWQGVQLCHIYAPHKKSLEAIIHTFLAIIKARLINVDIIHIHAVGPGLLVPFARLLGLKVVFTNHGPDYNRGNWGRTAKCMLRLGEYLGCKFANEVIVVSTVIGDIVKKRCGRNSHLIYNGVPVSNRNNCTDYLDKRAIKPGKYLLAVARFVPEKGLHDLLKAFKMFTFDYQLVIAGDADHETDYSLALKEQAGLDERVILTGYISGEELKQVFSHAKLFVLPSYHEGLPIALLEAMSYELPVLVSDIPANKEVELPKERYFPCGNTKELQAKIKQIIDKDLTDDELNDYQLQIEKKYNWHKISEQTMAVYEKVVVRSG